MVQSLPLQSQQSRGDFHHFAHLRIILPIVFPPLVSALPGLIIFPGHFSNRFARRLVGFMWQVTSLQNCPANTAVMCT